MNCDSYKFSYSANIKSLKVSDQSNPLILNFPTIVNGETTSGDYLSLLTKNYTDSPYIVSVALTASFPE